MDLDTAKRRFDEKLPGWKSIIATELTEEDTRKQIVDYMLEHVLGWGDADTQREPHSRSGYSDYVLRSGSHKVMVVEAKKAGQLLLTTSKPSCAAYKLWGPALKDCGDEIRQVKRYALDHYVAYAGLTSGLQWIAFLAIRTDGGSEQDHKAIVFPGLLSIHDNFGFFYDLFSKEGVASRLLEVHILDAEGVSVRHAEPLEPVVPITTMRMLRRSDIANDLDRIFNAFFSEMSGEKDADLLAKCFVETNESRSADVSLQKIARRLTNQIQAAASPHSGLQKTLRTAIETQIGEFVLLVGGKGAGKSTFTDRFFRFVLPADLKEKCLPIRIDVGAWEGGSVTNLQTWLSKLLLETVVRQIFAGNNPTFEQLQGAFYREYEAWREGEFKTLYRKDKDAFKIKFGQFLHDTKSRDPVRYSIRLLQRSVASDRLVPCVVFDNTDHHPQTIQDAVFQFAQAIYREVFSLAIIPITDQTLWQLNKSGPIQSFPNKAFYLPVPSTKEVLTKRVGYLKTKVDPSERDSKQYFLSKGIQLDIWNINAFAAMIEEIFITTDFTSRRISWLANHDIRRSLELTRFVVASPYIEVEHLLRSYIAKQNLVIPPRNVERAIVRGDYSNFSQAHNSFVMNVFSVAADDVHSPLVRLSLLRYLQDRASAATNVEEQHDRVANIERYVEVVGIPSRIVRRDLQDLLDRRLVESYDPTESRIYDDQLLRITPSGNIHFEFALQDMNYVTDMALVTPMRNSAERDEMVSLLSKKMLAVDWYRLVNAFAAYCIMQDRALITIPAHKSYEGQIRLRDEFRNKWSSGVLHAPMPADVRK